MDSTQNKLLLLFVFDKMEMPLSEQTILEMCCSANNWINYIDCKQALMQLIDANFVAAVNKGASNEAMGFSTCRMAALSVPRFHQGHKPYGSWEAISHVRPLPS